MDEPAFPALASGARFPVLGVIVVVVLAVFFASTIPFAQTSSYSAAVTNSGDLLTPHYTSYVPPQSGKFSFSWHSESGGAVSFTLLGPSGEPMYSATASSGSGHLFLFRAETYQFGFSSSAVETVQVTGTLSFFLPLI